LFYEELRGAASGYSKVDAPFRIDGFALAADGIHPWRQAMADG
jgi:hypothetical protein